jgi:multisubunit Na+/H+ antiporter MnhB subunit
MIDWYSVGFSALWILGLGLVATAFSFANYQAEQQRQRFRQALKIPACRIMIALGLVFFALGWTGSVSRTWERIVWVFLALLFAVQTWQAIKARKV